MTELDVFKNFAAIFAKNGFKLYLVGGSTRDFLLRRDLGDFDVATDATPSDMEEFLPDGDFRFRRFGNVNYYFDGYKFEITTLRKEGEYTDFRHPSYIKYVTKVEDDFKRRDFTVNAIYIDDEENVYDFADGISDLKKGVLKMIGDPQVRIKEDPLRILRALRFSLTLDFLLDEELKKAIVDNVSLLEKINPSKINIEIKKIMDIDEEKGLALLSEFNIKSKY